MLNAGGGSKSLNMDDQSLSVGIAAGILTALAMIPQLVKIVRQKKAEQLSILMILILMTGLSLWVWYGIEREDYPVIVTNAFSVVINALVVFFPIKYKKR